LKPIAFAAATLMIKVASLFRLLNEKLLIVASWLPAQ